ncbi:MAG TPA: hypothetical protein VHX87_02120 [Galbitalea sp.]|jgi:hypothetical protein|nr:hypothetical protein [Galbitalea sp.]
MTTLDFAGSRSALVSVPSVTRFGIRLVQLNDDLWRVTRRTGEVLGYIESFADSGAARFRAKRMFSSRRPSMPLGDFWSIDDAIDCFRFS